MTTEIRPDDDEAYKAALAREYYEIAREQGVPVLQSVVIAGETVANVTQPQPSTDTPKE